MSMVEIKLHRILQHGWTELRKLLALPCAGSPIGAAQAAIGQAEKDK